MKMKTKIILVMVLAILVTSGIASAQNEIPVNPPPGYYGSVTVNGQPAPQGTTIIAKIGGEVRGSITTKTSGFYGDNPGTTKLWIRGFQNEINSTVNFYLNDVAAGQTSTLKGAETDNRVDLSFTVPSGPGGSNSGGSSTGGGGGGGTTSGENASNIEVRESYELEIFKDILTSYRFTHALNPIRYSNITGNINAGLITTTVEVLKGTSSIVSSAAPGKVYKNVNILVGTRDFATPANLKESKIVFNVQNSWLTDNKIAAGQLKLLRWDGSKWITLDTNEIKKDATTTYFESGTDGFSPFAISGITEISVTSTPGVAQTPIPGITGKATSPVRAPAIENWMLAVIIAAVYFFIIRKK
ncbi:MAG: PGF-pre-PGF domain-containing protein [Candidatus Methanoperedens sp.]|nr:PGF-pre-PGF domain-containing protein [Candidatus Methanoperedens sp.]